MAHEKQVNEWCLWTKIWSKLRKKVASMNKEVNLHQFWKNLTPKIPCVFFTKIHGWKNKFFTKQN